MAAQQDSAPQLHIDSDWKAQAQAEKARLEEKQKSKGPAPDESEHGGLPPATFDSLVDLIASQAVMGLGAYADRNTGRVMIDLHGSKFSIDLLHVLEEKTKGNLTPEETTRLQQILVELRGRFVQIVHLLAEQGKAPVEETVSGKPGIVTP
ncbi:MAG: DUF1844 domain-containing protein [Phycisphaeraceae bacterium]|nr:DUF1844 domain-containing protein [Phycisphaerales bacterium]QOJ18810.1 MAG: DUF1844 domain-containing protein [Phycisphaeraceae bacterium]